VVELTLIDKLLVVVLQLFVGQISNKGLVEAYVSHQTAKHYQVFELVT